jgi:hypothetical protein
MKQHDDTKTEWTTEDLTRDFEVLNFQAPYVVVRRKADEVLGSMRFAWGDDGVRRYFDFKAG